MATDSALVNLIDEGDDEIATDNPTGGFDTTNADAYISMETDTEQLLQEEPATGTGTKESPFTFAFYTKLFDVDTEEITARLKWSLLPRPEYTSSFAKKKIRAKPDLYGPFWICVTLVFSVAIAGNVSSYFQYQFTKNLEGSHWHYDFHKVTLSAAIVFLYSMLVPSGVFAALWSNTPKDFPSKPSLIELVCIFGYSLAPLVPISLLWLIQISVVQWALVFVSFLISGGVLLLALMPIIDEYMVEKSKAYTVILAILALHLLLATGFMLCFFHVPSGNGNEIVAGNVAATITATPGNIAGIQQNETKNNDPKRDVNKLLNENVETKNSKINDMMPNNPSNVTNKQ